MCFAHKQNKFVGKGMCYGLVSMQVECEGKIGKRWGEFYKNHWQLHSRYSLLKAEQTVQLVSSQVLETADISVIIEGRSTFF